MAPTRVAIASLIFALLGCEFSDETAPEPDLDAAPDDAAIDAGPDADAALAALGEACERPNACMQGLACVGQPGTQFRCMELCETPDQFCASGAVCRRVGALAAVCYLGGARQLGESCADRFDCVMGATCRGIEGELSCYRSCASDEACEDDEICLFTISDSQVGYCRAAIGAPCADDDDCAEPLRCSIELGVDTSSVWAAGACTILCSDRSQCASDRCLAAGPGAPTLCVEACSSDRDCRINLEERCAEAASCAAAADQEACEALTAQGAICAVAPAS